MSSPWRVLSPTPVALSGNRGCRWSAGFGGLVECQHSGNLGGGGGVALLEGPLRCIQQLSIAGLLER